MRGRRASHNVLAVAVGAIVLGAALGAARPAAAQPPYAFTKIQYPGSIYTDATGINNAGQIVGTYQDAGKVYHGYVFDGTTYTTVDYPGAAYHYVFGIGPSGQILGSYADTDYTGPWHGFMLNAGSYSAFDFPGAYTDARGMNASGQIVGGYDHGVGSIAHGWVNTGGTYTTIDYPGSAHGLASGINDAGAIVGTYVDNSSKLHGYIYSAGSYFAVNFPTATDTAVNGINNQNDIVGWSRQGGVLHGFVYLQGSKFRGFDVTLPGATATMAQAINDSGRVVGTYMSAECPTGCGFLAVPQAGTAVCTQSFSLAYAGGSLKLNFTLTNAAPATWDVYLAAGGAAGRLWSLAMPALASPTAITIPINNFPPSGSVAALSAISTAAGGALCADVATLDTGR